MNGNLNNNMNSMISENNVASLLLHLNGEYIFDAVQKCISERVTYYPVTNPNIVYSIKQSYLALIAQYDIENEAFEAANESYLRIIQMICSDFALIFNPYQDESIDIYSAAYYIYDFMVSNYYNHMIEFFVNFIGREKNGIYSLMNLNDAKKSKDTNTIYCKKMFSDQKIAIISANLEEVLDNICSFDIDLNQIIDTVYKNDINIAMFLKRIIASADNNFFKNQYVNYLRQGSDKRPTIITSIRLALQKEYSIGGGLNYEN